MRFLHVLLAVPLVFAACRAKDDAGLPEGTKPRPTAPANRAGARLGTGGTTVSTNVPTAGPMVLPASGRIHMVNAGLRFVVVDYTLGGIPPVDSRLNVYRNNEKVAQLRLSGPERNGFIAADIVEGFVQVDDEVRMN